jgi:thiol:disulfide interchange protein DsbC
MNQRLSIIDSIDMKNFMIFKPKKTDHILTIFTDTSCPYCQKLHNEIPDLLENNIEIRYVLFSRNGNDVDAYQQLVSAWCSADKVDALEDLFAGDILDDISNCENPIARNFDYAGSLSVEGTPTIFLEDGRIIPGYQNYENILAFINK